MPKLGLSMTKGKIIRWLAKEGDFVEKGQDLFEIETEKLTKVIQSPFTGVLAKILVKEGEEVEVGTVIAYISEKKDQPIPSVTIKETEVKKTSEVQKAPKVHKSRAKTEYTEISSIKEKRIKISPRAKRIAAEFNIEDISQIKGSGPGGRIIEKDVLKYIDQVKAQKTPVQEAKQTKETSASSTTKTTPFPKEDQLHISNLSGVRQVIAERLSNSWKAPHIYLFSDFDMTEALRIYKKLKEEGVTLNDIFVIATAKTLKKHKKFNARIENGEFKILEDINIGIAVETEWGLVVPVVKNADKLSLIELSKKTKELIEKARKKELSFEEIESGTFTISNLGMFKIDFFTAIINPPQVAILSIGTIKETPVREGDSISFVPKVLIGIGADHRVIDGAEAARFLNSFKEYIENPWLML